VAAALLIIAALFVMAGAALWPKKLPVETAPEPSSTPATPPL
jgi:hypothetical protein